MWRRPRRPFTDLLSNAVIACSIRAKVNAAVGAVSDRGVPYHFWSAQYWALAPAGRRAGLGNVGWHDLRHSYRAWLDLTGAPVGVQKDCLRHASITTTMDLYGGTTVLKAKREAHGNVVQMLKKAAGAL